MRIYSVSLVVMLLVAVLDGGRYHWSDIPSIIQIFGRILLIAGGAIVWHVMMTNAFLSS